VSNGKRANFDIGRTLDVNAAQNILKEGISILTSAGTVDYTGGDDVRTTCSQLSAKPEAPRSLVEG